MQVLQVFAEVGGRKLLFVFPLTNAQLDLKTKSANVKHSTLEECRFWRSLSLGSESGQNKASKLNYWGVGVGVVGGGGRGGVELGSLF